MIRRLTATVALVASFAAMGEPPSPGRDAAASVTMTLRHGFARRSTLKARPCDSAPYGGIAAQIAAASAPKEGFVYFESGDTFVSPYHPVSGAGRLRMARKASYVTESLSHLGTAFVVPGPTDLLLGAKELKKISEKVPLVSASVRRRGKPAFSATRVVEVGRLAVCFVGLTRFEPAAFGKEWKWVPPERALRAALAECKVPARVVVSDLSRPDIAKLSAAFPEVRAWFGGYSPWDNQPFEETLPSGALLLSGDEFVESWAELELHGWPATPTTPWSIEGLVAENRSRGSQSAVFRRRQLRAGDASNPWVKDLLARWGAEWSRRRYIDER